MDTPIRHLSTQLALEIFRYRFISRTGKAEKTAKFSVFLFAWIRF